jgi:hypothetical protein
VIIIKNVPFTVAGVLTPKGQSPTGQDQDDVILLPISTATQKVLGANKANAKAVGSLMVQAMNPQAMDQAIQEMEALLRERHRILPGLEDDFTIRNLTEVFAAQESSAQVMSILLGAIASVSLIVGGIGIMNIMLVSVTERTARSGCGWPSAPSVKRSSAVPGGSRDAVVAGRDHRDCGRADDVGADFVFRAMVHAGQCAVGPDVVSLLRAGWRVLRLLPGAESGVPEPDRGAPL